MSMMIADLLSAQLFREVPYQDVDAIRRFSQHVVMDDGEFLIREDERDFDLFILLRGSVEIVSNERVAVSEECVLSRNHKELLGEIGWLTQRRRTAAVRCRGTVEAVRIDGVALSQYLMDNPKAGFVVMHNVAVLLAQRLGTTDSLLKQILWNMVL